MLKYIRLIEKIHFLLSFTMCKNQESFHKQIILIIKNVKYTHNFYKNKYFESYECCERFPQKLISKYRQTPVPMENLNKVTLTLFIYNFKLKKIAIN